MAHYQPYRPTTNFAVHAAAAAADPLQALVQERNKERKSIQEQPYRTTQLVFPNPKTKPDLVKNKAGLGGGKKAGLAWRPPPDRRTLIAELDENTALVHRQTYNNPKSLYSDQNVAEAIYVQTGHSHPHHQQQLHSPRTPPASISTLSAPVHRAPDALPPFKPQNSPTYRAILEEEGPGVAMPAVGGSSVTQEKQRELVRQHSRQAQAHQQRGGGVGGAGGWVGPRMSAPSRENINSVGAPNDRIAQSHSFKRLMWSVMGEY